MRTVAIFFISSLLSLALLAEKSRADCVILLHGLARTSLSLALLDEVLKRHGYKTALIDYPSTTSTIEDLSERSLQRGFDICGARQTHIVTHSMGGILTRIWLAKNTAPTLGRVVMMAPPNHGSEIVDILGDLDAFEWINEPTGIALSENGIVTTLPDVNFELGAIAGNQSLNSLFSSMIEGVDDGKVSIASTRVTGMNDHIVLPVPYTFMMNSPSVMAQILTFLKEGQFSQDLPSADALKLVLGDV